MFGILIIIFLICVLFSEFSLRSKIFFLKNWKLTIMNNFLNINVENYKIHIKSSEKYIKEM